MILLYHLILMQRLDRRIIFVKEQFSDGYPRITLHISLDGLHILGFEHILAHRLVHSPHNLAHVKVAIQLGTGIEVLHLIVAEQIEGKTIRHDILGAAWCYAAAAYRISCRADSQNPYTYQAKCLRNAHPPRYSGRALQSGHRNKAEEVLESNRANGRTPS